METISGEMVHFLYVIIIGGRNEVCLHYTYRQNKHRKVILDPGNIGNKAKKKRLYLVFLVLIVKVWQLKVSILQFVH